MKKIISLFQRNYDSDRLVRDEVVPGAEWVLAGEGVATRKWDGTCVLIEDGKMWKRYEVKKGKTSPYGFRAEGDVDPITGKQQGWLAVGDGPNDKWHREALLNNDATASDYSDGTYELIGPKIQGNPEHWPRHALMPHGLAVLPTAPRTFNLLRYYLTSIDIEGIVWHHPDGRMVKIKAKDFGIKRNKGAKA
jgi:hypothetical protein